MVGVDRPMKAPSMHIQKPYKGKIVYVLTAVILTKIIFSKPNSFMHMFNVSTMEKYQIVPSKAVVGVDRPVYAL